MAGITNKEIFEAIMKVQSDFSNFKVEITEKVTKLDDKTELVLIQATKTNGTVKRHEEELQCIKNEKAAEAGAKRVKSSIGSKVYQIGEKVAIVLFGLLVGKVWK